MDNATLPDFPPGYLEEDHGPRVIAANTTILVVSTILFALRLIARSLTPAKRGWDDHVLIPAYIFLLGLIITLYIDVKDAGLGRHAAAVVMDDPNKISKFLLLLYVLDWFYVPSNMLSRVSVVILYLRIFTDKWARRTCWAVIAFLVANCVATIIAAQLECMPLAYAWDKTIPNGKCFNLLLWYQLTNFPNIIGDVLVFILPIRTVWNLKASTGRKVGISIVCLTGSIGIIASSVRTSVFYLKADVINNDPTFSDEAFSWTIIECGLYFSAACLIGLRPLFAYLPRVFRHRVLHLTHDVEGKTVQEADQIRLNKYYNKSSNHNGDNDEDLTDIAFGSTVSNAHYNPRSDAGSHHGDGIQVETRIQVERQ